MADRAELARVPGAVAMYRAALALVVGDTAETVRQAARAAERAVDGDHLTLAAASALGGLARWGTGDLDGAFAGYSTAVEGLRRAGHLADVLGCTITLADILVTQGRLGDARRTLERALDFASGTPGVMRGTPDMHVGLSQVAWERGDLETAREHLRQASDLGEAAGLPQNPYRLRVAQARLHDADGDLERAVELLDDAERVYTGDYSPNVQPVPATRARVQLRAGDLAAAEEWARAHGLAVDDEPSYLREYEHLTFARLVLARGGDRAPHAVTFLERLLAAAEEGGRTGSAIEALGLLALARSAAGDEASALADLDRALALARPEGWQRVFTAEGEPMAALLRTLARRAGERSYAADVLRATAPTRRTTPRPARDQQLVDPLSDRELDVLRLLASELDGPDIARELSVSLNTLRTHTRHIYAKLGVNSRRAAVRRAAELDLLARGR